MATRQPEIGPRPTVHQLKTIARLYIAGAHLTEIADCLGITRQEARGPYQTCKRVLHRTA